jgi:hypothetical protein
MMRAMSEFDAGYYGRFYESTKTRVHGAAEVAQLATGIVGMMGWWGADLRNVLDVGAGTGLFRDWFRKHRPEVKYRSTEYSEYACAQYGHEQRDISAWRDKGRFDLVVCQGVLPYLDDAQAARAIDNLGAMARGFLYLEAITARDLREVCDRDLTDVRVHPRTGAWYRKRLDVHFVCVGGGLFYAKDGPLSFYELETARLSKNAATR